ncbi:MAG: hypothetical protein V4738_14400 [Pseudomonadota bacterium]
MTTTIDALVEALEAASSDLWLQVEPRHGAEAASKYPSIVKARAALALARAEQAEPVAGLTGRQRILLAQAWAMLEDYAADQKRGGNDSFAAGAEASAHEIKLMLTTPPAAPAKLEPLSDAELDALIEREWGRGFMPNQLMAHRAFARAVVAARNAKLSTQGETAP